MVWYSGESGSGKTETAKFAMQYLASIRDGNSEITTKITQSSCILEAFGNAKTSTHCNSSRFVGFFISMYIFFLLQWYSLNLSNFKFSVLQGKLIDMRYSLDGKIIGACIQTRRCILSVNIVD